MKTSHSYLSNDAFPQNYPKVIIVWRVWFNCSTHQWQPLGAQKLTVTVCSNLIGVECNFIDGRLSTSQYINTRASYYVSPA